MKHLLICFFLICRTAFGYVTESEPNDANAQADPVQCGDTVYCAQLSWQGDADNFRFTAAAGDSLILFTFDCNGSQTNTFLVLFDANDSVLATNDNGGAQYFSQIRRAITQTGEYVARVLRGGPSPDSTYHLWIDCPHPPPEDYDLCETARVVPSLPYYNEGSTAGQTNQAGTPAPDVFYRFSNPTTGTYHIVVCADFFNARVQILGHCIGDFLDDADTGCNLGADLTTFNLPPATYLIMVEGTAANQYGDFSIEINAQLTECPTPQNVVLTKVGGYPFLDWPELDGPAYYIVWKCATVNGDYEHAGTTVFTYFTDSTGYSSARRFYYVSAVCPW
jgi:hypothetical protein